MRLNLLPAAREDLLDLWTFGIGRWGEARADSYVQDMYAAIELLAENPEMAQRADFPDNNVRRLVVGSHVVFYRIDAETIDILRVLHRSRDAGRWL